jgi:molecular chaperone DnaK (HSP70)
VRFVIGIDLGTSNSALAYAELSEVHPSRSPELRELAVPQLIGPGDVQSRMLLSSSIYQLASFEWPGEEDRLPWAAPASKPERRTIIGEGAKKLGAKTPIRFIDSAKSWLCHGGVNRNSAILPWHAPDEIPKLSPVDASAAYLSHLREAWNHEKASGDEGARFEAQRIILTVPASFDEVARQLTLEAAKRAGYPAVTLIEEPLAAFYAFVAKTGGTAAATGLSGGERVLIADVGGGTTDFTMIEVSAPKEAGGPLGFSRSAVGDHLLLGGDNMDLALAHALEPALTAGKKRLDAEGWAELRLECRLAKEALFSDPTRESIPVVLAGRGSKLIGGQMKAELTRAQLETVIVEGYFPRLPPAAEAMPRAQPRGGFAEYGLPYASEPAITRHLAAFLLRHKGEGEPGARGHSLR